MHRMWYGEDRLTGTLLKPGQRYDKVVEALGGYGEYVTNIEDIKPALARAVASGLPACINVEVDPKPAHPVTMALDRHIGLLDLGQYRTSSVFLRTTQQAYRSVNTVFKTNSSVKIIRR